jgi:hypothetical protein
VHDHLRRAADGPVPLVHRGRDAVYLEVTGRCVGVVGARATAVPCALRTTLPALDVSAATIRDGVLHLDGEPLRIGRLVDVTVPPLPDSRAESFAGGALPGQVAEMVGRGDGLTPYDDDVICGWLAIHRAAGVATPAVDAAVRDCLHRTTLLSATLLDCAMHGEVIPEFAAFVAALGTDDEAGAAAALAAVGHTSGAGMLSGARAALSHESHHDHDHTEGAA